MPFAHVIAQSVRQGAAAAAAALLCDAVAGADEAVVGGDPTTITWEDLMPEGEEELLVEIYNQYYADLQSKWAAAEQTMMSQAGDAPGGEIDPAATVLSIQEGGAQDYMPQLGTYNV
ncbi:MAG: hypothetical protein MI723_16755, partial [Caulobacterales bacterium]|nr:hypothetical protein [Caulobacterales bacterium]